ncbi:hypothetical protein FACS1894172_02860 [Spirochaetia bacterium]|nr:hypothetical protein FACS1894164_18560 [Spirochaetia bacterium]GHU30177.1 hypothetical protein FACS1894172_02860 [Spirochaetia bacterium]
MEITILVAEEDLEYAIERVEDYCDCEYSFYDVYVINRNASCPLSEAKKEELRGLMAEKCITKAESYLKQAEVLKQAGDFYQAGCYYSRAGNIYMGTLTADIPVYNLTSFNYEIPDDKQNWFAITVDFRT